MERTKNLISAVHIAAKTIQHIIELAQEGNSLTQIAAKEIVDAIQYTHDKIKEHHERHVVNKE